MSANQSVDTSSIDDLLDMELDDLADIPEFKPFPAGAHICTISWAFKTVSDQVCPEITLKAVRTEELTNPGASETEGDQPLVAGSTTSLIFMLKNKDGTKNELGEGKMKELLKPLAAHLGTSKSRETMDAAKDLECLVVTKVRADKKDKDNVKYYTDIVNLQVI